MLRTEVIIYSPDQKQVGKAVFRVALTLRTFVQSEVSDDDYLTRSEARTFVVLSLIYIFWCHGLAFTGCIRVCLQCADPVYFS